MRSLRVAVATAVLAAVSVGAVHAATAPNPDSKTESIADGCNRSQLGLLGEAAVTMGAGPHPTVAASWVYVHGNRKPTTLEGTALGTHTAGTDLFGVHDTYDFNVDVAPDPAYQGLLSSRNAQESPPQIHTEWESGLAPLFAWPEPGDHVRETGSQIWDCGHWQDGNRKIPDSDFVPGDPAGTAGVEPIGGEEIEIHPIMELATWRSHDAFVPGSSGQPVVDSRLDVALSNQGGKAKGVEECALASLSHPAAGARRFAAGRCSQLQDITGSTYTYDLPAPGPQPTPGSVLRVARELHYSHAGPNPAAVTATVVGDHVRITVPFAGVRRTKGLQDFGATWRAWWSQSPPAERLRVTLEQVRITNNLGVDNPANSANPTNQAASAWNMYVNVANTWVNLHDPRPGHVDYVPGLGAVPSAKATPVTLATTTVPAFDVSVPAGGTLRVFTDARECQQPGYVDCPTKEFGTNGRSAGRAELALPVSQLTGRSTTVTIHPPVCSTADCPENMNPPSLCPTGCYDLVYRIDDLSGAATPMVVTGDGTAAATSVNGVSAASKAWWVGPTTRYAPDQDEENVTVARILGALAATRR